MTAATRILDALQDELRFDPELLGGRDSLLQQIDRFLSNHAVGGDFCRLSHPALWSRLVEVVTIPETSFFRHKAAFGFLEQWVKKRGLGVSVRALTIPCSTGEEPYSVAMALAEAGVLDFHVVAADVSASAVERSKKGHYGPRSLRSVPDELQQKYFVEGTIDHRIQSHVDFRVANIFGFTALSAGFDIIFCRNLLIYLPPAQQTKVFGQLNQWLTADGLLFLGPGEATVASAHGWKSAGASMSFAFTRRDPISAEPGGQRPRLPIRRPTQASRRKPVASRALRSPIGQDPDPSKDQSGDALSEAIAAADRGDLEAARRHLILHRDRNSPSSLLLDGILSEKEGRIAEAEQAFRKVLYLEPTHHEALYHLIFLLESQGRIQAAGPLRRRIERLAEHQ